MAYAHASLCLALLPFISSLLYLPANAQPLRSFAYPHPNNCLENTERGNLLESENGTFALKYSTLKYQKKYLVIAYIKYKQPTIIWAANRNTPFKGPKPCLRLGPRADLILEDTAGGSLAWSANVSGADHIKLENNGNLVLQNAKNETLWESFDYPTDIIVQGGYLAPGRSLISAKSAYDLSHGPYEIKMKPGGAVSYANFPSPLPYGVWTYSPLGDSNTSLNYAFNSACNNTIVRYGSRGEGIALEQDGPVSSQCDQESQGRAPSSRQIVIGDPVGDAFFRFVRLDSDGGFRTYRQTESQIISDSDIFAMLFQDVCKLPAFCGSLGICSSGGICECSDDVIFAKAENGDGCSPRKMPTCGSQNQVLTLQGVDYFANAYINPVGHVTLDQCRASCLSNCSCAGAFFWENSQACYHYEEIKSLRKVSDQSIKAFIKVGPGSFHESTNTRKKIIAPAASVAGVLILSIIVGFLVWRHKRYTKKVVKSEEDEFLEKLPGLPPRFSYKDMEDATDGFNLKLGAGGFGSVYEGRLPPDGRKVAVKKLGSADHGHVQFRAEVATLGSINHLNLVRLVGFCAQGPHRLLVYEHMINVSLDRWLFRRSDVSDSSSFFLDWKKRFNIIHDTAQGLAFLHEKSSDKILHLDVKPQNILLDENFRAKLADFGLAKLMDRSQSRAFTRMRGTPGYLAPEWLFHASASDKSDVYSFGMVLLEIISGRKNVDRSMPEDMEFFPCWAIEMIEQGKIMELVDPRLGMLAENEQEEAERVIKIAFWCIQEDERARPSMKNVILMVEGHVEVGNPPLSIQFLLRTRLRISAHESLYEPPNSSTGAESGSGTSNGASSNTAATISVSLSGR